MTTIIQPSVLATTETRAESTSVVVEAKTLSNSRQQKKDLTSSSKDQTESTPQLLSEGNTGAKAQQSSPSPAQDNTQTSIPPTKAPLEATSKDDNRDKLHAMLAKAALSYLAKNGLVRRYKVLSKDKTTVIEYRVVFDAKVWSKDFDLLSEAKYE